MRYMLVLLLLTSCAYTYEPTLTQADTLKLSYHDDLNNCQDDAQPGWTESLLAGISPIARGAKYPDSVGTRIDKCMKAKGYDVKEEFTLWHL